MDITKKKFWINLSLINLCVVALLGFSLRTKFMFPVPFIDYRNFLSAHSHFAFGGWVGLVITTLFIFHLLPAAKSRRKIYLWVLAGLEISSVGMAVSFPLQGYGAFSLFFSSLYIIVTYIFGLVFIRDIINTPQPKTIRLLSVSAIVSLLLSAAGPSVLAWMMITHSADSLLYRDAIYTFLHFQYNGFFTLGVFALFFEYMMHRHFTLNRTAWRFSLFICLSVIPALFLSLLWHNSSALYVIAGAGCILILTVLYFFIRLGGQIRMKQLFREPLSYALCTMAFLSFGLKMFLNVGTIIPQLGNAVYGDRPVIIGFLHLVFLAFVTFFVLAVLIEERMFYRNGRLMRFPFYVFGLGVIGSEILLMLQGLEILFKNNNYIYSWLLWISSIILFLGAFLIMMARLVAANKKATQ